MPHTSAITPKIIAILDLGSNSLRMSIIRIANKNATVLNQVKHMVRLGEGAFLNNQLQPESMDRTLNILKGFSEMCEAYGVSERLAIATAAVREAKNGAAFLRRIREKTDLEFTIVSGKEEARLIYKGVSGSLEKSDALRLFIDIGGGSTELTVANSYQYELLDSIKVGCVRLANQFFHGNTGPVSLQQYRRLQSTIRDGALHTFKRINEYHISELVGSSGTIKNLAEIATALGKGTSGNDELQLSYTGLSHVVEELCKRSEEERKELPALNTRRTGILIPGAAILQTVMEETGCNSITISTRGLKEGVLADYMAKEFPEITHSISIREESVLNLARHCRFEEKHSHHVATLAMSLFDSARDLGLHSASSEAKELLYYAALLHDIGIFIAFPQHHAHTHYLISNTELLGFNEREISLIAATAFAHRAKVSRKSPIFSDFDEKDFHGVRLLALLLTLAEAMDKSHRQSIQETFFRRNAKHLELFLHTAAPCPLEIKRLENIASTMEKIFEERVAIIAAPYSI